MPPEPRRALGVDPGSIRCGWGVVELHGNRFVRVASGHLAVGKGALPDRLDAIYRGLLAVATEHRPTTAAIESLIFHRNAQSALRLGEARGVALLALHHAGLAPAEYEPSFIKKSVTGSGAAPKEQVSMMVQSMLGFAHRGALDETDALAIAICHLNQNPLLARRTL